MNVNSRAQAGMGTLIIFIAMILVAAVAAGVLISTTSSLQNKALATGKATTAEVGSNFQLMRVSAEDGQNQNLEEFVVMLKLAAGSGSIKLDDLLLSLNLNNATQSYTYNDSVTDCSDASQTVIGTFGVTYSINATNHVAGYVSTGDVVELCFQSSRSVIESEKAELQFIPKIGATRQFSFVIPDNVMTKVVQLYP